MSRDHTKLKVFELADALVFDVYRATRSFPVEERFGLQAQLRRAAVSVPTNIVEGCSRRTTKDFLHFVSIALGSASEARYLISLGRRLELISDDNLERRYTDTIKGLEGLIRSLADEH